MEICGINIADGAVEATVEASHEAIRPGSAGAFVLHRDDLELLVVVAEIERRSGEDRRSRDISPLDALEAFWFEDRDRRDRRRSDEPATLVEDDAIAAAIRDAVERAHDLEVGEMLLTPPGVLPRTPDGQLDRESCLGRLRRLVGKTA